MKQLALLTALALVGCASTPAPEPASARWQTSTVEVHWLRKQDVGAKCAAFGLPDTQFRGCARSKPDNIKVCEVYLAQPTSFDDAINLEVLGHEVWHCFGAVHN